MADFSVVRLDDMASAGTASTIVEAARRQGMLYLVDHGVDVLEAQVMDLARAFFALPEEQRMEVAAQGAQDSGYRGADPRAQVFSVTRTGGRPHPLFGPIRWPRAPQGFAPVIEAYVDAMYGLAMKVLAAIATGFDLPSAWFLPLFGDDAIQNLQLRCYDARAPHNPMPLDAHSDPPPITLIAQDDLGGLESLSQGRWLPVTPRPRTLVCQFGAMMARWTDDRCPANVHRVRATENTTRFSIVYNLLPRADAVIERLPTCRSAGPSRHAAPAPLDEFLRGHLAYEDRPVPGARDEGELDPALIERCREVVGRDSDGRWSLQHASRAKSGILLRMSAGAKVVELDVSPCEPGGRYYKTSGGLGFSYRGRLHEPETFAVLDRLLPALATTLQAVSSNPRTESPASTMSHNRRMGRD